MMHAKMSVIDGRWLRVGSTDFNPLGIAVNYELDAVIEDRSLGEQAEAMFLEDLEQSQQIDLGPRGRLQVKPATPAAAGRLT
jgi:cardiolipin synthase